MAVQCEVSSKKRSEQISLNPHRQKTLRNSVSISGIGLFTAEKTTLTIHPAEEDVGIVFQRMDLPKNPRVKAQLHNVVSTPRCTILGNKEFTIHTVEHVLAALNGMGIDNALLELFGPEVPIMDGSAAPFVEAILKGEMIEQEKEKIFYTLESPVSWSKGDVHLVALPSESFRVSYTLHYPNSGLLHSQYYSNEIDAEVFIDEIGPCRTFCLYEEIAPLIESGLIKGGGLDNAIIIKNDAVINPEGIRFPDEMVRHKILDLIGDLSLLPVAFHATIIAIRSGHASNISFAHKLFKHLKMENS